MYKSFHKNFSIKNIINPVIKLLKGKTLLNFINLKLCFEQSFAALGQSRPGLTSLELVVLK